MGRFKISEDCYPYFLTSTIVKWLPVFVSPATCDIVIDSLQYCRDKKGLRIHAYVIMPTHLHLVLSSDCGLTDIIRDFKRHTASQIVKESERRRDPPFQNVFKFCGRDNRPPTESKVWQNGNHPEMIINEDFFRQKTDYIHNNPFHKGLITDPHWWTYSSVRDFEGSGSGPLAIDLLEW